MSDRVAAFAVGDRVGIAIGPESAPVVRTGTIVRIELCETTTEAYWVDEADGEGAWPYDAEELVALQEARDGV